MLDREVFTSILEHFNLQPTLDAFACQFSALISRYMSLHKYHQVVAQDALLQPWDPVSYLFPPVPLLPKVIRKIRNQKIRVILVCPQWPTALWWGLMQDMMVEPPMMLPHYRIILETLDNTSVTLFLDSLVALHLKGRNLA